MDKYFRVEVLTKTPNPQQLVWQALHQDYSENFVFDEPVPSEKKAGEIAINRCLKFNHWGVIEHPQITFNVGYFPHSTMQQIRTHRTGISVDCQSGRYTGQRIIDVVTGKRNVEEVFYLRPVGSYPDRKGAKSPYSEQERNEDLEWCYQAAMHYKKAIENGRSEEHARGVIPFDIRQHFVLSLNARSLIHVLNMRYKKDAQLECQQLCELIIPHFQEWMPEITNWYLENFSKVSKIAA